MVVVWQAWAANDRVQFPENYKDGVHYATVNRGGIREEIFANLEAITAAKAGQPTPDMPHQRHDALRIASPAQVLLVNHGPVSDMLQASMRRLRHAASR